MVKKHEAYTQAPRFDELVNQQRAVISPWSRRVYFIILIVIGISICNYLVGDIFILRADGIPMADRRAVDAAFPARVVAVYVRPGDSVESGVPLLRLESADVEREIADLSARNVELSVRETQLRVD